MPLLKPAPGIQINKTHPLARGLVGWWLAYPGTTALDVSGNGNHGTFIANTHVVSGKFGHAWDFDGTGDYIQLADNPLFTLSSGYAFSAWIKLNAMPSGASKFFPVISQWGAAGAGNAAWVLRLKSTNANIQIGNYDGSDSDLITGNINLSTGIWYHIAATWDGSTAGNNAYVYVNAVAGSTDNTMDTIPQDSAYDPLIGYDPFAGDNTQYFNGQIDHLTIHARGLTATEIGWLYREPFAMFQRSTSIALLSYAEAAGEGIAILRRRRAG